MSSSGGSSTDRHSAPVSQARRIEEPPPAVGPLRESLGNWRTLAQSLGYSVQMLSHRVKGVLHRWEVDMELR